MAVPDPSMMSSLGNKKIKNNIEKQQKYTKYRRWQAENSLVWTIQAYVDADWAGDRVTRKSVSGWCVFLDDCLISWCSRGQKKVSLSSTEAEYLALPDVTREILQITHVMEFLSHPINYPIIVNVDNVGAILLAENGPGKITKHIDVRYHFVKEYVENNTIKVVFVRSEDNTSDPLTKNTNAEIFRHHTSRFMQLMPSYGENN